MVQQRSGRAVELKQLESQQERALSELSEVADRLSSLTFDTETSPDGQEKRYHMLSSVVRVQLWRQQLYDVLSILGWRRDETPNQVLAQSITVLKVSNPALAAQLQFTPGGRCRVCSRVPLNREQAHECWDGNFLVPYQEEPNYVDAVAVALKGEVDASTVEKVLGAVSELPRAAWDRAVFAVWERRRPPPQIPGQ